MKQTKKQNINPKKITAKNNKRQKNKNATNFVLQRGLPYGQAGKDESVCDANGDSIAFSSS